jgi:hypothetical protein
MRLWWGVISFVLLSAILASVTLAAAPVGARKNTFVIAKVPLDRTVSDLLRGRFKETVTCRKACILTTSVRIRPKVARSLGFKGVKAGQWLEIATNKARLRTTRPMKVGFVLTSQAKRLLPRAKGELQILGHVAAIATLQSSRQGAAGWIVTLR